MTRLIEDRVLLAEETLDAYVDLRGDDYDDDVELATDIITDIMHLCESRGLDFEDIVKQATAHFNTEQEEEA